MKRTIGFIGGGRITRIFLQAFRNKGFNPAKIVVFEMHQLGIKMGPGENESRETVEKTLTAAIETLYHSGLIYEDVIDLIPVKPIASYEPQIKDILSSTLTSLYEKIKS